MSAPKRTRRAKVADSTVKSAPTYATYWLTRNRTNGELASKVDIWRVRPERLRFKDDDVSWVVLDESAAEPHYNRWTLEQARREVRGAMPETDLECVRVGNEETVATPVAQMAVA